MAALDMLGAMQNVKTMLSSLTAWQAICGVSTAALAAERIFDGSTEDYEETTLCPCILLNEESLPMEWQQAHLRGRPVVEIRVEAEVPEENSALETDAYAWARGFYRDMLAGIAGAVGGSGGLMIEALRTKQPPGLIDSNTNNGRYECGFILELVFVLI